MDQVLERPAALDVHKAQVTACVRTPGEGGQRRTLAVAAGARSIAPDD